MIKKLHLIKKNKKILDALTKLDKLKVKILFVIDNQNTLLGSLSEGDIRRSLIKGKNINSPILGITNNNPDKIYKDKTYNISKLKKQLCYPLIDKNNKIIDIIYHEDLLTSKEILDNAFFILAGGKGKRLMPLTKTIPKPLAKVDGKPILKILLENISSQNFKNIFISLNYKKEKIKELVKSINSEKLNIKYINEKKYLGTAGSIGHLKGNLNDPFFIMNADLIYKINYRKVLDFFYKKNSDFVIVSHYHEYKLDYGELKNVKTKLISITEKPLKKYLVASGIYLASQRIQQLVKFNEYLDMPDLIHKLIAKGLRVNVFINNNYWKDISDLKSLKKINIDFNT